MNLTKYRSSIQYTILESIRCSLSMLGVHSVLCRWGAGLKLCPCCCHKLPAQGQLAVCLDRVCPVKWCHLACQHPRLHTHPHPFHSTPFSHIRFKADWAGLLDELRSCSAQLEVVERGLNDFLDTKKMAFPRWGDGQAGLAGCLGMFVWVCVQEAGE